MLCSPQNSSFDWPHRCASPQRLVNSRSISRSNGLTGLTGCNTLTSLWPPIRVTTPRDAFIGLRPVCSQSTKDAIRVAVTDPKNAPSSDVRSAYQVARLIRNAFAHRPFDPTWSIDADCRDCVFEVPNVERLDTSCLDGRRFDWRDYGGPLALLRLAQFIRYDVLGDERRTRAEMPPPRFAYHQQGDLILERVDLQGAHR